MLQRRAPHIDWDFLSKGLSEKTAIMSFRNLTSKMTAVLPLEHDEDAVADEFSEGLEWPHGIPQLEPMSYGMLVLSHAVDVSIKQEAPSTDLYLATVRSGKEDELTFELSGRVATRRGETLMRDSDGRALFRLTRLHADTDGRPRLILHDFRDHATFSLRRKGGVPGRGRGTIIACRGVKEGATPMVKMYVNVVRSAVSVHDVSVGVRLGVIHRRLLGVRKMVTGIESFHVRVFAGADVALMAMFAFCFDGLYSDGAGSEGFE